MRTPETVTYTTATDPFKTEITQQPGERAWEVTFCDNSDFTVLLGRITWLGSTGDSILSVQRSYMGPLKEVVTAFSFMAAIATDPTKQIEINVPEQDRILAAESDLSGIFQSLGFGGAPGESYMTAPVSTVLEQTQSRVSEEFAASDLIAALTRRLRGNL